MLTCQIFTHILSFVKFLWTSPPSAHHHELTYNAGCTAHALLQITNKDVFKWPQHQSLGRSHCWLLCHEKWPLSLILYLVSFNWFSNHKKNISPSSRLGSLIKSCHRIFIHVLFWYYFSLLRLCELKFSFTKALHFSQLTMFTLGLSKLTLLQIWPSYHEWKLFIGL